MKGYLVEREKVGMQQPVPAFMGHGCPDPALGNLAAFGVERGRNDDGLHAALAEPGES
jgi:hypothetical protein